MRSLHLLLSACALLQAEASQAGYVCPGNNWFNIATSIDESTVPTGLVIKRVPVEKKSRHTFDYNFELSNANSTPMILPDPTEGYRPNAMDCGANKIIGSGLQPGWCPIFYRFANGKYSMFLPTNSNAYQVDENGVRTKLEGWQKPEEGGYQIPDRNLFRPTAQKSTDGRPDNVQIPPDEHLSFTIFVDGKPVEVRGTLHYEINPNYDQHGHQKCEKAAKKADVEARKHGFIF